MHCASAELFTFLQKVEQILLSHQVLKLDSWQYFDGWNLFFHQLTHKFWLYLLICKSHLSPGYLQFVKSLNMTAQTEDQCLLRGFNANPISSGLLTIISGICLKYLDFKEDIPKLRKLSFTITITIDINRHLKGHIFAKCFIWFWMENSCAGSCERMILFWRDILPLNYSRKGKVQNTGCKKTYG